MDRQNHEEVSSTSLTGSSAEVPNADNASYTDIASAEIPPNIIFAASKTEISSSILPPPDLIKGYNDVIPNGAERIMRITEKEQEDGRRNMREDMRRLNADWKKSFKAASRHVSKKD